MASFSYVASIMHDEVIAVQTASLLSVEAGNGRLIQSDPVPALGYGTCSPIFGWSLELNCQLSHSNEQEFFS